MKIHKNPTRLERSGSPSHQVPGGLSLKRGGKIGLTNMMEIDKTLQRIRKVRIDLGKNFDCVKFIHSNC